MLFSLPKRSQLHLYGEAHIIRNDIFRKQSVRTQGLPKDTRVTLKTGPQPSLEMTRALASILTVACASSEQVGIQLSRARYLVHRNC